MPRPNGPQFVTLYRGLYAVTPEEVSKTELGAHWSPDVNVAYRFATGRDSEGNPPDIDFGDVPMAGTVVEAKVHRRHIIDPESSEGQGWQDFSAVLGPDSNEQERTVRPKGIVHIQKMHYVDDATNTDRMVKMPKGSRNTGRA